MRKSNLFLSSLALFAVVAGNVSAQDWSLRSDDRKLSDQELQVAIVGQTLIFYDNGRSAFSSDGTYAYTYDQGGTAVGSYDLKEDATVCIQYANGFDRCDMYVRNGERLVLLTAEGERYPVRP